MAWVGTKQRNFKLVKSYLSFRARHLGMMYGGCGEHGDTGQDGCVEHDTSVEHDLYIDGDLLLKMISGGLSSLVCNIDYLNGINVFPVSDGDTGTNMKITFNKGLEAVSAVFLDRYSFGDILYTFSRGMLADSRGNSGFLLSQYFLGVSDYIKDKKIVGVADLCKALLYASGVAYGAMLKPVEGTMLTVMRDGIENTLADIRQVTSIKEFFGMLVEKMFTCVMHTIMQMEILKDNNIVDSGALGFYLIFDGMNRALNNEQKHFDCLECDILPKRPPTIVKSISFFRFCTEFSIRLREVKSEDFYVNMLVKRGDSIAVTIDKNLLKVHIHANSPKEIIAEFAKLGDVATTKIDDLFNTEEFDRLRQRKHENFVIVGFVNGKGSASILEQSGADVVFPVPLGHRPTEGELKTLIGGFVKENSILFADDKHIRDTLKTIKWFSHLSKTFVLDANSLTKIFTELSSLVFSDDYKTIVKSLESLKKQKVFETSITASAFGGGSPLYNGYHGNKLVTRHDLGELLEIIASNDALVKYSTLFVFVGKDAMQEDIQTVTSFFEKNTDIECVLLEGKQQTNHFIIGAF